MAETILKKMVTINGAEYTITSDGKVYGKEGKEISVRPNTSGYASFTAGRKGKRTRKEVHRLVAVLVVDNPNHYDEVDHKDSDRMNPRADNLEWVTRVENIRRIYERRGDINKKRKLTEEKGSGERVKGAWILKNKMQRDQKYR